MNDRVHDRLALDTQVRAWAEAFAFGGRDFCPGRTKPFDLLLEQAQIAGIRQAAARSDHGTDRRGVPRER